jgi:hypothetical protein
MNVTPRTIAVAAGALAVAAGAFLLVRLGARQPTDEERIRALLGDAAVAVQERRVGDAMRAVSERFAGEGMDRQGVKALVTYHALRGDWVRVAVANVDVEVHVPDDGLADATLDVVLARSGAGQSLADLLPAAASAYRIACGLAEEEGEWRIVAATWRPIDLSEAIAGPGAGGR